MIVHLVDEVTSALVDDQLEPVERVAAQAHLATCAECQQRLQELRSVVLMLRAMPTLEPPRSFALGPRVVADPPNVVRLRRWYTATRIVAGSLAAVFVVLSASALYVDSRAPVTPGTTSEVFSSAGSTQATQARDAAKPPAAPAPAGPPAATSVPAAAPAVSARSAPASNTAGGEAADQVAAATSVRALPTPPPTPTAVVATTVVPIAARVSAPVQARDDVAPFRSGALALGLLTVIALLVAVFVRHRLHQASSRP